MGIYLYCLSSRSSKKMFGEVGTQRCSMLVEEPVRISAGTAYSVDAVDDLLVGELTSTRERLRLDVVEVAAPRCPMEPPSLLAAAPPDGAAPPPRSRAVLPATPGTVAPPPPQCTGSESLR
jgi:hypothetical protein